MNSLCVLGVSTRHRVRPRVRPLKVFGDGIRDGRGYGPYETGYYSDSKGYGGVLPFGPAGEHLSVAYDFQPNADGHFLPPAPPKKVVPGATVILGAMPRGADLAPYFLTELPTAPSDMAALYNHYLRAYDNIAANIRSIWHPVTTGAVQLALSAIRDRAVERWNNQTMLDAAYAVQILAGVCGFINAYYKLPNGDVDWKALDTQANAEVLRTAFAAADSVIEASKYALEKGADAARGLADAASTAGWVTAGLVAGGLAVVGLLGWKLLGSAFGQNAAAGYIAGRIL